MNMTSDTHSAEVLAQRKRMHVIWDRWGQGLPLEIEFTEHAHAMATVCFRGTPPRAQCEWPAVHKACDPWVLQKCL